MSPVEFSLSRPSLSGLRWVAERVWSVEHAFERAKAAARPEEDTRVRVFIVQALFVLAFVILALGAAYAALLRAPPPREGVEGTTQSRADLVDRNGRLMAVNLVHYRLYLDPEEVWDRERTLAALTAALPDLAPVRLRKALTGARRAFLAGGLTPAERARVHALALPGISFEAEDRRVYPLGRSGAHLIGFADSGGRGLAGVERGLDAEIRRAGQAGQPVSLAVDLRIQAALEDELARGASAQRAHGAVGLVTDVHTGEILAMASWPGFDINHLAASGDGARFNRAASAVYEMGSTFKVFTIAAGLDTGQATLASTFDATAPMRIGARQIHDYHAENRVMSLADVFIHSSNIGTSRLALEMGRDTMVRYFDALGLLRSAPVELAESARPLVPRRWSEGTIASASFGHAISVTPLQLAAGMGAVLNGGVYTPLTLRRVDSPTRVGRRVVSERTSRAMLDLMRLNVTAGTGAKADAPGLSVGGKTGSAEKAVGGRYARDRLVSSFAAVFPTQGPLAARRYFVLVLLDEPQGDAQSQGLRTGGWTAAPIAGRVIDRIAPFLGVERDRAAMRAAALRAPVEEGATGEPLETAR